MPRIVPIAFIGGDCSGKSSIEAPLRKALNRRGIGFVFVPEGATRVINQYGINPKDLTPKQYYKFQKLLLETHMHEEDVAYEHASQLLEYDTIVLGCDRGIMCIKGYMSDRDFCRLLREKETNVTKLRDLRYDGVIHMVTAADGALAVYKKNVKNNPARHNRPAEEAVRVDKRIQTGWLGHEHLRIIDNSTDWPGKEKRAIEAVMRIVGIPEPIETERRFLLHHPPDPAKFPVPFVPITIAQNYLDNGKHSRIRERGQRHEGRLYDETWKRPTRSAMSAVEHKHRINVFDYTRKKHKEANPDYDEIEKIRHYFVWKNQVFELDRFIGPDRLRKRKLWILEIELDRESDHVEIPEWLGPVTEITGNPEYKNRHLAKRP